MANFLSPLSTKQNVGHHGAVGETGVTFSTRSLRGMWQIAGWADFEKTSAPLLKGLGLKGLGDYRQARQAGDVTCWRIAPDRLLFEGCGEISEHMSADLVVLDLSHARTVISVSGPAVRDLLMQIISIDMSHEKITPGDFLQTGIHHVSVLVQCTDVDSFDILVPGTWAEAVWDVLYHNAAPHGIEVAAQQ